MVFLSCNFVEYETRFVLKFNMSILIFGKCSKGKSFHYKKKIVPCPNKKPMRNSSDETF